MTEINECYQSTENLQPSEPTSNNNSISSGSGNDKSAASAAATAPISDDSYVLARRTITSHRHHCNNNIQQPVPRLPLKHLSVTQQENIDIVPTEAETSFDIFEEECDNLAAGDDIMTDYRTAATTAQTKLVAGGQPSIAATSLCRTEPNSMDKGQIFNVARRKKVELQNLSPKVTDLSGKPFDEFFLNLIHLLNMFEMNGSHTHTQTGRKLHA